MLEGKLNRLKGLAPAALYASPTMRALESAAIVGAFLGLQPTISPELVEIDFGGFEGLTYKEIEDRYPREFKLWMEKPTEIKFPGGESFSEMKNRVLNFKDALLESFRAETVVVVSHAGTNRVLLAQALGIDDSLIFRIDQAYGALNIIDYSQPFPIVRLLNG